MLPIAPFATHSPRSDLGLSSRAAIANVKGLRGGCPAQCYYHVIFRIYYYHITFGNRDRKRRGRPDLSFAARGSGSGPLHPSPAVGRRGSYLGVSRLPDAAKLASLSAIGC